MITEKDFVDDICMRILGMTNQEAADAVTAVFDTIKDELASGGHVHIPNFGFIYVIKPKGLKWVRSKFTGKRWQICHRWEVRFRVSPVLKKQMNPNNVNFRSRAKKPLLGVRKHASRSSTDDAPVQGETPKHTGNGEPSTGGSGKQG